MTLRPTAIVVDALPVPSTSSGVGTTVVEVGAELRRLEGEGRWPAEVAVIVRCAADVRERLARAFPAGARFETPIRSSRPAWRRVVRQQVIAPVRDARSRVVLSMSELGPMWGRATAVLVIHDVRRLTAPQTAGRRERGLYGFVIPRAARHAHSILTVSDFSAAEIGRTLGTTASVDVVRRHPAPVSAEPGVSEEGRALVVGAIRSYKGLDTVTEALSRLDGGGVRVTWAGANEQAAAAIRSHPDVELLGWVDDARLDALRRQAWISLNPSRYEGYGLAVAESLAYGLPTVASDIPAHREVAGAAAEYFPPGDPAALAATLRRLRRDPALVADLAGRARERAHWLESRRSSWGEALLTVLELAAERR